MECAVEKVVAAGLSTLIFVSRHNSRAVEDHFDADLELGKALLQKGKQNACDSVRNVVPSRVGCLFVRQPGRWQSYLRAPTGGRSDAAGRGKRDR